MTEDATRSDGELLGDFAATGNEAAFGELVRRHGPMVHNVCRRILSDHHEAEDVAQAAFLTLARKARGLSGDSSVGGWLHRVAWCLAMDVRKARERRNRHEEAVMREASDANAEAVDIAAFRAELDTAVAGLPEKYRRPVVLFHLEERSVEETAGMLGLNPITLRTRLVRAREMLRAKLVRRGVAIGSVGALTTLLSAEAGAAVLPATFVSATVKAAGLAAAGKLAAGVGAGAVSAHVAALTKGAANMLFRSSVKTAAIAVAVTGVVVGTGTVVAQKAMDTTPSVGVAPKSKTVDLQSLFRLRREGNLLACEWIWPTIPAGLGRFESSNPRLSCVAYGVKTRISGPATAAEIDGTNMAERAGSGIWNFKMRTDAADSNFWVMVMYGIEAPIACIEYIQSTNQLRLIRTVWTADGRLDPDKRLDVRTDPNIEELKTKAGEELRKHLAPVLAMVTTQDLIGPVDNTMRFFETDNGKTVSVPVGQEFEVHLTNDREGAGWEPGATEITGKSVARVDKLRRMNCDEFVPADPSTNSTKGTYIYRYKAATTGESNLRFTHLSPSGPKPVARDGTMFIGEFKLTVEVNEGGSAQAHAVTPARLKDWLAFARSGEFLKSGQVTITEEIPPPKPGEWAIRKGQVAGFPIEFNGDKTSASRRVIVRAMPKEKAEPIVTSVRETMGKETDQKGPYHSWREVTGGPKITDQKLLHVTLNEDVKNSGTLVFMVFFGPNFVQ